MKILYLIAGHSSSGKTSLARSLGISEDNIIEADKHPLRNIGGQYTYNPDDNSTVFREVQRQLSEFCQMGISPIAFSNAGLSNRDNVIPVAIAKRHGYTIVVIQCQGVFNPDGSPQLNGRCDDLTRTVQRAKAQRFDPFLFELNGEQPERRSRPIDSPELAQRIAGEIIGAFTLSEELWKRGIRLSREEIDACIKQARSALADKLTEVLRQPDDDTKPR